MKGRSRNAYARINPPSPSNEQYNRNQGSDAEESDAISEHSYNTRRRKTVSNENKQNEEDLLSSTTKRRRTVKNQSNSNEHGDGDVSGTESVSSSIGGTTTRRTRNINYH